MQVPNRPPTVPSTSPISSTSSSPEPRLTSRKTANSNSPFYDIPCISSLAKPSFLHLMYIRAPRSRSSTVPPRRRIKYSNIHPPNRLHKQPGKANSAVAGILPTFFLPSSYRESVTVTATVIAACHCQFSYSSNPASKLVSVS